MTRWNYWNRGAATGSGKKYGNHKVETEDGVFDSRKEARRNAELQLLAAAGEIHNLRRQVRFELIPAQREPDEIGPRGGVKKGKVIEQAVFYVADFVYLDAEGQTVVEDVKGYKDGAAYKVFVLKRKMFLQKFGIRIREV